MFDNPASTDEKIEALVFKEMYNTYKNEVSSRTGKKKQENIVVNIQEDPQLSENEVILKVERALREKKLKLNKSKNLLSNNSFLKDDENNSLNQELQMLTMGKTSDQYKNSNKTHKREDPYPLDYQTYKRNLESKRIDHHHLTGREKDNSLSIRVDDSNLDHLRVEEKKINSYNLKGQTHFPTIKYKNPFFDLKSNNSQSIKNEYSHPGIFVKINLLLIF